MLVILAFLFWERATFWQMLTADYQKLALSLPTALQRKITGLPRDILYLEAYISMRSFILWRNLYTQATTHAALPNELKLLRFMGNSKPASGDFWTTSLQISGKILVQTPQLQVKNVKNIELHHWIFMYIYFQIWWKRQASLTMRGCRSKH